MPGQPVVQPLNSNDAEVPEDDILNFFKVGQMPKISQFFTWDSLFVFKNLKIAPFPKIVVWFFHLLISQCYKCYDLIPTSAKLVILDTELILKQVKPHHVFVMGLSKTMLDFDFMYHLDNVHKMLASIYPRM